MRKTARRGQDADEQDGRRCKKRNGGQETNARARNEQEETPPTTRQRTGLNDLLGVADVLVDDRIFGRVDGRTLGHVDDRIVEVSGPEGVDAVSGLHIAPPPDEG